MRQYGISRVILRKNSTAANDEELHRDGLIRELMNSQRRTPVAAGGAAEKGANGKIRVFRL
jgi:hypothetical protein